MSAFLNLLSAIERSFGLNAQMQLVSDPDDWAVPEGGLPRDAGISVKGAQEAHLLLRPRFQVGRRTFFARIERSDYDVVNQYEIEVDTTRDGATATGTSVGLSTPAESAQVVAEGLQTTFDAIVSFDGTSPLVAVAIDDGNAQGNTVMIQHMDIPGGSASDLILTDGSDEGVTIYADATACSARVWVRRPVQTTMPTDVQPEWIVLYDLGAVNPEQGLTKSFDVGPYDRMFVELHTITGGATARPFLVIGKSILP